MLTSSIFTLLSKPRSPKESDGEFTVVRELQSEGETDIKGRVLEEGEVLKGNKCPVKSDKPARLNLAEADVFLYTATATHSRFF